MEGLLNLIVWFAFGLICAAIASGRGRTPVGWFFIGLVAPCLGPILALVLPNLKVEAERRERLATENRRLRERVKKDRLIADQRHGETVSRLGVHDVALGVDTSEEARRLAELSRGSATPLPPPLPPTASEPPEFAGRLWCYAEDGEHSDPISFDALRRLWQRGHVDGATLVWAEGMPDWREIREVDQLARALDA